MNLLANLRTRGYCHLPGFAPPASGPRSMLSLARKLGQIMVPPEAARGAPYLRSDPSATASEKRPFDWMGRIGWHNDFTTRSRRPRWTLLWIARADPGGDDYGAWRVASSAAILSRLKRTARGRSMLHRLERRRLPFGYEFDQRVRYFKVLYPTKGPGLRFNGRAMLEGSRLAHGCVAPWVREAVAAIEHAAEESSCRITARSGDLLVVDNWRSLHDRLALSSSKPPRICHICFVQSCRPSSRGTLANSEQRGARWK